jgi:hypothetical protein
MGKMPQIMSASIADVLVVFAFVMTLIEINIHNAY